MPDPAGGLALDQPVGADDTLRSFAQAMINNQQMVGHGVIDILIALGRCVRFAIRGCPHLLVEDPVSQGLHGVDLASAGGKPDPEAAAAEFRKMFARFGWLRRFAQLAHRLVPLGVSGTPGLLPTALAS